MDLGVILLAGDRDGKTHWKANGREMGKIVLGIIIEQKPEKIVITYDSNKDKTLPESDLVTMIDHGDSMIDNLKAGIETLTSDSVLIITSDLPFINNNDLRSFISDASALDADIVYAICSEDSCGKLAPGLLRTCVNLKDGTFTGGNAFLVKREKLNDKFKRIKDVFSLRKKPFEMAAMLGLSPWDLCKLFVGHLFKKSSISIAFLEEIVSKSLGLEIKACIAPASIGSDVDTLKQLGIVNTILEQMRIN